MESPTNGWATPPQCMGPCPPTGKEFPTEGEGPSEKRVAFIAQRERKRKYSSG